MKKTKTAAIICCACLAALAASCSSSKGRYDGAGTGGSAFIANNSASVPQAARADAYGGSADSGGSAYYDYDENAGGAAFEQAPLGELGGEAGLAGAQAETLMYIKTASVSLGLKSENFDADFNFIKNTVTDCGGFFEKSHMNTAQAARQGKDKNLTYTYRLFNATIRVPAENYEYVKNILDGTGVLYSSTEKTQEVSAEYFNTQSRLDTYKAEKARLLEIIEQESDMRRVITYESRLNEVSTQIDIYESQLRRMREQVSYSTITLDIRELPPDSAEKAPEEPAFWERLSETFKGSAEGTLAFFQGALVLAAYVCLPLIIAAALTLAGVLVYKKAKKAF